MKSSKTLRKHIYVNEDTLNVETYTEIIRPLSEERVAELWDETREGATLKSSMKDFQDFAKAIQKAQGIL